MPHPSGHNTEGRSFIWALDRSRALCGTPRVTTCAISRGTALHPVRNFAVSLPLFSPYGGIEPSSLGSGSLFPFENRRHCSHLSACAVRLLAATCLTSPFGNVSVRTFLSPKGATAWIASSTIISYAAPICQDPCYNETSYSFSMNWRHKCKN
jgi:hypothetical protein